MPTTSDTALPRVSVVVCTYNRSALLARCLESLRLQDYGNLEVLVVDNGSSDDTRSVARAYPVTYLFEGSPGVSRARNRGIEAATGELVGFVDDDEEAGRDWVRRMTEAFALGENVAAAGGPAVPVYEVEPPAWMPRVFWELGTGDASAGRSEPHVFNRVFGTGCSMFRRRHLGALRFRTDLGRSGGSLLSGEDTELVGRLLASGWETAWVPRAKVDHFIPRERIAFRWLMRRALAEGRTELLCRGYGVVWRRAHKLPVDLLRVLLALLTFDRGAIAARMVRFARTAGIFSGAIAASLGAGANRSTRRGS